MIRLSRDVTSDDIRNEIRAIERVCKPGHRNIVDVISVSKDTWENNPAYFIQMELCDGDMDSYIGQRYREKRPVCLSEIADIMIQVLNGLVFLHSHNEVHRDLKPKNGNSSQRASLTPLILCLQFCTLILGPWPQLISTNQYTKCGK